MTTPGREDGVTLIELLVSMAVLGILLAISFELLGSSIRHNGEIEERSVLQAELRGAVDQLARDLRQAYTGDTSAKFEAGFGPGQLTFYSPDAAQPFHLRRIAYRVSSGRLERAVAVSTDTDGPPWSIPALGPWTTVLGSIADPAVFTYQDENGATAADPLLIRTVGVQLVVATRTAAARRLTYRTTVEVRAA